jgi:Tfp pilus assembly protein PilO
VGGKKLAEELEELRKRTKEMEDNLVIENNLAVNLWYFYNFEEQTKVQLPELNPLSSPLTDKAAEFRRMPYGLRVLGTYEQVSAFLYALETGSRLLRITSFNLARADPAGQAVTLDLNVELLGKK